SKIRRIWLPLDSKKNLIVPSCAKKQLSDSQSVRASASSDADWHSLGRARAYLSRVSQRKERRKTGELSLRAAPCSDHANGGFWGPIGSTNYWQLHPECGSSFTIILRGDGALMQFSDRASNRQPKTHSVAFGGKVSFKYVRKHIR